MPNTPALLQTGATGLFANANVSADQQRVAEKVLASVGITAWVANEDDIDAVTALSGSGPAYFFLVMEAMQEVGINMGLAPELVQQFVQQTALGAARMADGEDVAELRRKVTSPGGTTEAALGVFEQGQLKSLFAQALEAARERGAELAAALD
jgi:pyrroline-5-carboxylate reductase